jgi:hypothetical protein
MDKTISPCERLQLVGIAAVIMRHQTAIRAVEATAVEILGPHHKDSEHTDPLDYFNDELWGNAEGSPELCVDEALRRAGITVKPE